jgi:hypothetical protein
MALLEIAEFFYLSRNVDEKMEERGFKTLTSPIFLSYIA